MAGVPALRPAGSIAFNQYEPTIRATPCPSSAALAMLALVDDLLKQGKLVAPLPQRFSNPRSYYLVLADRAAANPAVDAFRLWLADQVESDGGGTTLSA